MYRHTLFCWNEGGGPSEWFCVCSILINVSGKTKRNCHSLAFSVSSLGPLGWIKYNSIAVNFYYINPISWVFFLFFLKHLLKFPRDETRWVFVNCYYIAFSESFQSCFHKNFSFYIPQTKQIIKLLIRLQSVCGFNFEGILYNTFYIINLSRVGNGTMITMRYPFFGGLKNDI